MNVQQLSEKLSYKPIILPDEDADFTAGYTSDLLSDVMGNAPEDSVLITIQAHKNTVAVASLVGIKAIVLCNGRSAAEDMQNAALKEGVAIFSTGENQFTASCAVGNLLQAD
jgi:hypothetical protein